NVCVDYLNGRYPAVTRAIRRSSPDDLCVSSVAVAELRYGSEKSVHRRRNHARLDVFLGEIACVDFDRTAASVYGRVRAALEKRGALIGPYDMQIAAHAPRPEARAGQRQHTGVSARQGLEGRELAAVMICFCRRRALNGASTAAAGRGRTWPGCLDNGSP